MEIVKGLIRFTDPEANHPLIAQWLKDGWEVARPRDNVSQMYLHVRGWEPSTALYGIWIKKV